MIHSSLQVKLTQIHLKKNAEKVENKYDLVLLHTTSIDQAPIIPLFNTDTDLLKAWVFGEKKSISNVYLMSALKPPFNFPTNRDKGVVNRTLCLVC